MEDSIWEDYQIKDKFRVYNNRARNQGYLV